jgi:hypothetical protein
METVAVAVASVVDREGEVVVVVVVVGRARESFAQATAWLAPLPPGEVAKESAVRVSPGRGSSRVVGELVGAWERGGLGRTVRDVGD